MAKKLISYDDTAPGTGLPEVVEERLNTRFIPSTAPDPVDTLNDELVTSSGWTLGAGWSGDLDTGFVYDGSGGGTLSWEPVSALQPSTYYLVSFTVDGFDANNAFPGDLDVMAGGMDIGPIYKAIGATTQTYAKGFQRSDEGGPLSFTPKLTTPMTIREVSLRQVTGSFPATSTWRSSDGTQAAELRTTGENSFFLGNNAGRRHMGTDSVGIGTNALENDLTGFFNVGVGRDALRWSQRASRNSAVGYNSLSRNVSGPRNTAMGSFSGYGVRSGKENVALGVDSMFATDGTRNVGVGVYTLANASVPVESSIAIGFGAVRYASGDRNIGIGESTINGADTGADNIAVGYAALFRGEGGSQNIAVGGRVGFNNSGSFNIGIGERSLYGAQGATATRNVAVGIRSGNVVSTAERNVLVGYESGIAATTAHRNTVLGYRAGAELTTGQTNIVIGNEAGDGLTSGARNILIGAGMEGSFTNDFINIGSAIYANRATKTVGIGVVSPSARIHLAAATGGQGEAPIRIDPGALVPSPRSGNLEFDGDHLYITIANVRRKVALVTE